MSYGMVCGHLFYECVISFAAVLHNDLNDWPHTAKIGRALRCVGRAFVYCFALRCHSQSYSNIRKSAAWCPPVLLLSEREAM
jgi:hypothetical protein